MNLRLFNIAYVVDQLGPGKRLVLWTQGCPFNCRNCSTPDGIPRKGGKIIDTSTIIQKYCAYKIDGITLTGGEPMLQAEGLLKLISLYSETYPEKNVICFTGFTKDELKTPTQKDLAHKVDLLILNRYEEEYATSDGLAGSTNQAYQYNSEKLIHKKNQIEHRKAQPHFVQGIINPILVGITKFTYDERAKSRNTLHSTRNTRTTPD